MTRSRFYALAGSLLFVLVFCHRDDTCGDRAGPRAGSNSPGRAASVTTRTAGLRSIRRMLARAPASTCHDESYKGTKHALAFNARTPAATHGCESCHGPGQKHAESGDPDADSAPQQDGAGQRRRATCMTCHSRAASHALWDGSQHDQRNIGCVTCHSVHASKGPSQLKARTVMEQCATCHRRRHQQAAPVQPHAGAGRGDDVLVVPQRAWQHQRASCCAAGTTIDESCTSCHTDKRGPYLWEHAPVSESCVTCHDPHGSNNDRMLVSKLPFLCQRCHVTSRHPPTVYDGFQLNNTSERQQDLRPRLYQLPSDGARLERAVWAKRCCDSRRGDAYHTSHAGRCICSSSRSSPRHRRLRSRRRRPTGQVDVGGMFTATDGDEARYERYRDLRDGAFTASQLGQETGTHLFDVTASHIGYRDQRYNVEYLRPRLSSASAGRRCRSTTVT